ncbi:MAG: ATP-binding cassette domain-containing protein [Eubacteriales bacterium]|nr:ATP-binding cassette domain-containing protein [Eubacteriales bacterium]
MDIAVKKISKSYGEEQVLKDFSCDFLEGKLTCIMGRSGGGKTTLIKLLMGLEKPTEGSIEGLFGKKLSAVFQEDRLCENLSAAANIRLVCRNHVSDEELKGAFQRVCLDEVWRKPVRELSGGMRRRVAILRALFAEYDCLILDEPLKGLDEETKQKTAAYILEKTQGKTVLAVTHEEEETELLKAENIVRM